MLFDVVRAAAAANPERPAVVAGDRTLTYGELVGSAKRVARGLRARGIARFGVPLNDPLGVVELLVGSAAAGSEACVYPRDLDADAVAGFARRLDHDVVVADHGTEVPGVTTIEPAELDGNAGDVEPPTATPVMILTTGTSGVPKGVRHDWARLIAAVRRSDRESGATWLLAYNPNQFAGFQVLLHAFVHASTVVIPRSSHARDVMEAMSTHAVTHASATPTFWRLLVGAQHDELAATVPLRQITLGGEAAPESLISRLKELFPDARISHVYAGTEFGSVVSVRDGHSGLPLSILDRPEDADVRFRVVDGELQVRSRNAMLGYHGGDDAAEWHPTGDLVEEREGRLHFVGRTTEIINVGGAKVHPLPIEELISTVDGVVLAAVHGAPNAITGQIVAVDVVAAPGADQDAVKAAIQQACSTLPPPGRPRRIRFVDALDVRGQKVVRGRSEESA